ncbi:MAG: M3 family oligoendopeptidase [Thermoanaerobaculia bacterium]
MRNTTTQSHDRRTWTLTELLPDASEAVVSNRLTELEELVAELEAARSELETGLARDRLIELLALYEALTEKAYVLSAYGSLWFAEDTQSEAALAYRNVMDRKVTEVQNRVLFFSLWWKGLDDEEAVRLAPDREEHADYAHFLEDLRRTRPFMLEERSEQIVNLKDTHGMSAVLTVYSMLTNRLEFALEVDDETRTLTRDGLMAYVYSPRAELREAAYREVLRVFEGEAKILSQMYVSRALDWHSENVGLRGFSSPISVRNVDNDVPDRAVEILLDVCTENAPLFQRYFRWKAGELGQERLSRFDLYAPLAVADRQTPYAEAARLVLSTFERFDAGLASKARRVFEENHIDSEVRTGKKGGAFCATVLPRQTPWVLLNYTGKVRDVATMAHELGHAVHSMLAEEHSVLTQHPSLPLAETASVFAERLLVDRLLESEDDRSVRRELLASSLDDIYATVMRQAYFVRFEERAHAAILEGKSPEELSRIYLGLLTEQFGEAVAVPEEFAHEWVSIPHIFHTPFYCYAYSFGQLLVLALYRRFRDEGDAFIPGYLRLLAWGGSARPEAILAEAGVDMTDPDFWQGGFDVVADLVDELERL